MFILHPDCLLSRSCRASPHLVRTEDALQTPRCPRSTAACHDTVGGDVEQGRASPPGGSRHTGCEAGSETRLEASSNHVQTETAAPATSAAFADVHEEHSPVEDPLAWLDAAEGSRKDDGEHLPILQHMARCLPNFVGMRADFLALQLLRYVPTEGLLIQGST